MENVIYGLLDYGPIAVFIGIILAIIYDMVKNKLAIKKETEEARIESGREKERQERDDELYNRMLKMMEDLNDKYPPKIIHTRQEQDDDMAVISIIQKELDELIQNGASHAYLFKFHNGGVDVLGRGLLKMTMAVESSENLSFTMMNWQSVPRSMMAGLYKRLVLDGEYYIHNVDEVEQTDRKIHCVLKDSGAKSAVFRAIKNEEGLIAGFVGVEFNKIYDDFSEIERIVNQNIDRISGAYITIPLNEEWEV